MLKEEKEREVGALHNKLDVMQTSYEAIIQVTHAYIVQNDDTHFAHFRKHLTL